MHTCTSVSTQVPPALRMSVAAGAEHPSRAPRLPGDIPAKPHLPGCRDARGIWMAGSASWPASPPRLRRWPMTVAPGEDLDRAVVPVAARAADSCGFEHTARRLHGVPVLHLGRKPASGPAVSIQARWAVDGDHFGLHWHSLFRGARRRCGRTQATWPAGAGTAEAVPRAVQEPAAGSSTASRTLPPAAAHIPVPVAREVSRQPRAGRVGTVDRQKQRTGRS